MSFSISFMRENIGKLLEIKLNIFINTQKTRLKPMN